jgi:bacterial/archaeal transporter family-2 protein
MSSDDEVMETMELVYVLLAIAAGSCTPIQAGINSRLGTAAGSSILAALISFAVGTLTLLAYSAILRISWPSAKVFLGLPWWVWTGGSLGAFFVAVTIFLVPKLGAATMMASLLAGQMVASIFLDHYGLLGYPLHPTSTWRLVGVALIMAGIVLIRRF